tara:strand:- start:76 stop:285 length:210 start_codon:yes stop_codon:yes gene_type:complete
MKNIGKIWGLEMIAMAKMIYLHFRLKELKGEKVLYDAITVDNVNEFTFDELNYICSVDSEIQTIKKLLK